MTAKNKITLLVLFLFASLSCNRPPDTLQGPELVAWYSDPKHGYIATQEINDIVYELKRIPLDVKILSRARNLTVSKEDYQKHAEELGGLDYFEAKIKHKAGNDVLKHGLSNDSEYLQRVDYLSFKAKEDFNLSADGAKVPCQLYHFERSYGLAKHISISLAFPRTEAKDNLIVFTDNVFGAGQMKFRFEQNKGPKLKF